MNKVFKVGLIGCGHIAETYFRAHKYFNNIKIIKCADINLEAAKHCANTYNIEAVSVEEILEDKEIEIILNLTIPKAHYEIAKKALESGKHTYSEKPLAVDFNEGKLLLELSKKTNLYIGCAPDTFLGGGIQKTKDLIDKDVIGEIKLGNAIFAFPGVQSYHPNPESWFDEKGGGPVIDMGPYYFTALVSLLGPAKHVQGRSLKMFNEREIGIGPKKGKKFKVNCSTSYLAIIEFENNSIIQITLSFDVAAHQRNHIEFYGTKGSAIVPDPNMFGGSCQVFTSSSGKWNEYKTDKMTLGKINITAQSSRANESASNANYRGVGLSEMAYSIEQNLEHRCSGELSLHVLDIITSTMKACTTSTSQEIKTTCKKPNCFSEDEVKKLLIV
jgi:predicted dehydrogenase|tara:strand:+ start:1791 stop:2951 length:1161 start_codon:yes stop_codon:yes gene_type:complete